MSPRPKTSPESPVPKAFTLGEMSADIQWIKTTLEELKGREYVCYKEGEISGLRTWRKILSGILAAVAITLLGSTTMFLVTCEQQSEARGVLVTRVDNHSTRITTMEQTLHRMEEKQQESTAKILSAIDDVRVERRGQE